VKKTIGIEKLVQWAMREELPKGQSVSASPWQIVTQYCALGVRVDVSGYGDGLGFLGGEPHADALIVAEAIRALDTRARFADRVEVLPLFGDCAGIAGDAVGAIMGASFDQRAIVISHATMGTRPAWAFELPSPSQRFYEAQNAAGAVRRYPVVLGDDADAHVVMMQKNEGRARARDGEYTYAMSPRSPIEWCDPAPLSIAHARAQYVAWHAALSHLATVLAAALESFAPAPLALPLMPWLSPTLATRLIFRDAFARYDTVGLPLQPKREAGRAPIESPIEAETRASYGRASREKMRRSAAI
jgi:hypothetical protein